MEESYLMVNPVMVGLCKKERRKFQELVCLAPIISLFHLFKFPSAALSSIAVATATTHSSALQTENLSCMKQFANWCESY